MNILMIGPDRSVHGGISAMVNNLFDAGLSSKVNLNYIGTMSEGSKLHKLLVAAKAYFCFISKLSWADIVHVNVASDSSFYRKSLFIKAAHRHHKKIVIHQHGGNFDEYYMNVMNDGQKENARKILGYGDSMIVLTPEYKDFFENQLGIKNIIVLPNSIKIPEKNFFVQETKAIQLLFLGRVCKTKGVAELLDAIDILKNDYPNIILYIGGIYEDISFKARIESMNKNVKFLGWINGTEKEEHLKKSDVFVLPTYFEGQPISVLEAMANCCCVVASNVGGIPMMIEDGKDGVLVEPKNVDSLVNGLRKVIENPEFAKELTDNAYAKVKSEYSIEQSIDRIVNVYEAIL